MPYFLLLRPHNWIKNFFIFVPLFFAHELTAPDKLVFALGAFIAFCTIASTVYIINDIADVEHDRLHYKKKHRPIAAGRISVLAASGIAGVLLLITAAIVFYWVPSITPVIAAYFVLNLAYSWYLKRIAIVDVLMVSGFYLLRVSAGALAVNVPVSGWLLLATIFVSLFLVVSKRKAELAGHASSDITRPVLTKYTPEFLNVMLNMSVVMMLVVYSVYTVTVLASHRAAYSMFFVLLGVFRYLYLAYTSKETEQPERVIFSDFWIFVSAVGWIVFMYLILY